jgi:hypothetical protein
MKQAILKRHACTYYPGIIKKMYGFFSTMLLVINLINLCSFNIFFFFLN